MEFEFGGELYQTRACITEEGVQGIFS